MFSNAQKSTGINDRFFHLVRQSVDNETVRVVAVVAVKLASVAPTILEIERLNKTYRDYSSHHHNHIGI